MKPIQAPAGEGLVSVEVTVRQHTGTYQTNTINGVRASCTHSPSVAAANFGRKYFGTGFVEATHAGGDAWMVSGRKPEAKT